MNNLDKQYIDLLEDILENGVVKKDRTGTGTISVFGRTIRHNMKEGFPLLTTKKMAWKQVVTELAWFLRGETNIQSLVKDGNYIWVGDAYKFFEKKALDIKEAYESGDMLGTQPHIEAMFSDPDKLIILTKEEFINKIKNNDKFAMEWGEMGPIYGAQWRKWHKPIILATKDLDPNCLSDEEKGKPYISAIKQLDQIDELIKGLKGNPDSRRLMVSAWNVADIEDMKLPPCHYGFQCYTRDLSLEERIDFYYRKNPDWTMVGTHEFFDSHNIPRKALSLKWNQRSVDTPLGLPFNIASYGLLLLMLAIEVNMVAEELIGDLGDTHIYLNQIDGVREQVLREPYDLPEVFIDKEKGINCGYKDIELVDYECHPTIKFPLSN